MKRIRLRKDAINQGAFSVFEQRRREEGRSAFTRAVSINDDADVVEDRRQITTGPVGGPWWLFKAKTRPAKTH